MPATIQSIVDSAYKEWDLWGKSIYNRITNHRYIVLEDDSDDRAKYVLNNYCKEMKSGKPSWEDIRDDQWAWSAVGMVAIMRGAGLDKNEFPFTVAHHTFIRRFIKSRKEGVDDLYWGYRIGLPGSEPAIGDLIAYARFDEEDKRTDIQKWEVTRGRFDREKGYESHTDVVVDVRHGEIDVIGANVEDSVTLKTLALSPSGHLIDQNYFWFATLKFQG